MTEELVNRIIIAKLNLSESSHGSLVIVPFKINHVPHKVFNYEQVALDAILVHQQN